MDHVPVVWLHFDEASPARGYWDQGMLEDVFSNRMWKTGFQFDHQTGLDASIQDGAVIIMPARHQKDFVPRLNAEISRLKWVVLFLTGDEESVFPVEEVRHPNIRIWVMSPQAGRHDDYGHLGSGYPPFLHNFAPARAPVKDLDFFFSGQNTNVRRKRCMDVLLELRNGYASGTPGFTQGLCPEDYVNMFSRAKAAPCPSGPETPDTFRLFEALELGCVPIADARVPKGTSPDDYWDTFLGEHPPFPVLTDYANMPEFVDNIVESYPALHNRVLIWWLNYKRNFVDRIADQIVEVSGKQRELSPITVLMPSSPTVRHPSTDFIEETITNVRVHLPDAEIIIMLDGVRPENEHLRENYEEYQRRLLWLCNFRWTNITLQRFEEMHHQSGMTLRTMDRVRTPFLLFVEHDTPLTPDCPIEWDKLMCAIETGSASVIRFHHESLVLAEHEYLMLSGPTEICGAIMRKTCQWSQRPHLASTAHYREMMAANFSPDAKAFIEHGMYGKIVTDVERSGMMGWNLHRLWIYTPEGDNIKRSYNLNGRGDGENFESIF